MPSDAIYQLVTSGKTVTAAMEQDPTKAVDDVAHEVFPEKARTATRSRKLRTHDEYTKEEIDRAEQCGKFPYRPSDLFLKVRMQLLNISANLMQEQIYLDVLDTLEHGPLKNMCSPALMGSSGVIPITVISL